MEVRSKESVGRKVVCSLGSSTWGAASTCEPDPSLRFTAACSDTLSMVAVVCCSASSSEVVTASCWPDPSMASDFFRSCSL